MTAFEVPALAEVAALAEPGHNFQALELDGPGLSQRQLKLAHAVTQATLENDRVRSIHNLFAEVDMHTLEHQIDVMRAAVVSAVYLGEERRSVEILSLAAAVHDAGKIEKETRAAIKSTYTFIEKPSLRPIVRRHPADGKDLAAQIGFGPNEQLLIGGHHLLQPDAYGIDDPMVGVPEADGYVPDVPRLLGILASSDVWVSFTKDAERNRRPYMKGKPSGPAKACEVIEQLNTASDIKLAIPRVAGHS